MPTDTPAEGLADELLASWLRCLPDQPELGRRVIARYAEPHRRYHDTAHLAAVLRRVEELADDQDLFAVRLAAFYHDAVYAIPAGQVTNEEASARLSVKELGRAGLEVEELNEVARLVRLTATHVPGSRDRNGELLCDADLAVLAGSPEEYASYVAAVEQEYARLPRESFAAGRLEVLLGLRDRDLFRTGRGRAMNPVARANIEREVQSLAAELGVVVEGSDA